MHIEFEKLFTTPDELVDFLCKPNEEQDKIITELLVVEKKGKVEMFCKISDKAIGD